MSAATKAMQDALKALEFTKIFIEAYQGNALNKDKALEEVSAAQESLKSAMDTPEPEVIALEGRLNGWSIQNLGKDLNEFIISTPSGLGTVVREKDSSISSRILFGMAREIMQTWREETPEKIAQRISACAEFGVHLKERRPGSWQWSYEADCEKNDQHFSGFSSANSAAKSAIDTLGIGLEETNPQSDTPKQG